MNIKLILKKNAPISRLRDYFDGGKAIEPPIFKVLMYCT